jgi:Zn-finger nucleic acid-binding protein
LLYSQLRILGKYSEVEHDPCSRGAGVWADWLDGQWADDEARL